LDNSIVKEKKYDRDYESNKNEKVNFVNEFLSFDEALKVLVDNKFPEKFIQFIQEDKNLPKLIEFFSDESVL
jgi:hypothetical protein